MTDRERADRVLQLIQGAQYVWKDRPNSPRWNEVEELLGEIGTSSPPTPDPEPEPEPSGFAPRTYNKSSSGDARFCVAGLPKDSSGAYVDAMGVRYDDGGRDLGGRDGSRIVPGIKASDMMDDNGPCDGYEWQGRVFPPWPPESYLR